MATANLLIRKAGVQNIEDSQYIIAYKYTNGRTGEESWISDAFHNHLSSLFKNLPDYILRRKDVSSLEELYQEMQSVTNSMAELFERLQVFEANDYELHLVKKDKTNG